MSKPKERAVRIARFLFWWLVPLFVLAGLVIFLNISGWIGIALYPALVLGVLFYVWSRPLTPEEDAIGQAYKAIFKDIGRLIVGLALALVSLYFVIWLIKRMWEAA